MENPILSSLPSMSRSTSTVTQVDVTNFLQCLWFDPKSMDAEHKFNRHGDFKLPNSSDDLKRLRAGLRESTIKARERVKVFSETLSVINKCFPSIPSRKRSRPDGLLLNRAPMGTQNHSLSNDFDFDQQKVEERGKTVIPNKRTRTSLVDQRLEVQPNTPARSSGNVDRVPNKNVSQSEGMIPIVADGWEKGKMKKKRTTASNPNTLSTKPIDGYRETKQGILPDSMARLNDSHGFRPANGIIGGKIDGPTQQMNNTSLLHDKERTNLRTVNTKSNVREEFTSGSPTSSTKPHTTARGPRSGSKSTVGQRATAPSDWDRVHGTNKNPSPKSFGPTNRKHTPAKRYCGG